MYRLLVAITLLTCFSSNSSADIIALGTLGGPDSQSFCSGISADGSTVVGQIPSEEGGIPIRWTHADGMIELELLPGATWGNASAVSADGNSVVGTCYGFVNDQPQAYLWTPGDGMVGLGGLGDESWSVARGISWDGSVVVGNALNKGFIQAMRWTADEGMVSIDSVDNRSSGAGAVSGDVTTIVGSNSLNDVYFLAFRWTQSTGMIGLGDLPGGENESSARAVSADGSVVVGFSDSGSPPGSREAFRWTAAEGMVGLGFLPGGDRSSAYGVSADGSIIIGTSRNADGITVGFVWTQETGMRSLYDILSEQGDDLSYWTRLKARGISADGRKIAGEGDRSSDDKTEVFLATLEPSIVLGDVNLDGEVNLLDVQPFVVLLQNSGYQDEADINLDGAVNLLDVEPFVALLTGG